MTTTKRIDRLNAAESRIPAPPDLAVDALLDCLLLEELRTLTAISRVASARGHALPGEEEIACHLTTLAERRLAAGVDVGYGWIRYLEYSEEVAHRALLRRLEGAGTIEDLKTLAELFEACHARRDAGEASRHEIEQAACQRAADARARLWQLQAAGAPPEQIEQAERDVRAAVEAVSATWVTYPA